MVFIIIIKNIAWSSFFLFLAFNLFPFLYRLLQSFFFFFWREVLAILFLEINRFRREDTRKTVTIFKVLNYSNLPIIVWIFKIDFRVCVLLFLLLWVVVLLHSFLFFLNSWKIHEIVVKIRSYWCLLVFFLFVLKLTENLVSEISWKQIHFSGKGINRFFKISVLIQISNNCF